MRRLTRTKRVIERQLPQHAQCVIIPRGYCIPLDKFMSGARRFARPVGSVFPVIVPNNTMTCTEELYVGSDVMRVSNVLGYMPLDSVLTIVGGETVFVCDVDRVNNKIKIRPPLQAPYVANTRVNVHAIPLTTSTFVDSGSTIIVVETDTILVNGDVISEMMSDSPFSLKDIDSVSVTLVGENGGINIYSVVLSSPLQNSYSVGDTIYVRAFPAYRSDLIPLPTQQNSITDNIGPFLWDVLESRLHDGISQPTTTIGVETLSPSRDTQGGMKRVSRNDVHTGASIPSSFFGLWDIITVSLIYEGDNTVVQCDDGEFLIQKDLVPSWYGLSLSVSFDSDSPVVITIGIRVDGILPQSHVGWDVVEDLNMMFTRIHVMGQTNSVISIPHEVKFNLITIGGYSHSAGCNVTLKGWQPSSGVSTWVKYTIMSRVTGDYTWASSGLIIKPVFMNRHDMSVDNVDSSLVMF